MFFLRLIDLLHETFLQYLQCYFSLPTSKRTPTIIRTILYKKPFPRKINIISSSPFFTTYFIQCSYFDPLTVERAEQNEVKSCVPSNS